MEYKPLPSPACVLFDLDDTLVLDRRLTDRLLVEAATDGDGHVRPATLVRSLREEAAALWDALPERGLADMLGTRWEEMLASDWEGCHPNAAPLAEVASWFKVEAWRRALAASGGSPDAAEGFASLYVRLRRSTVEVLPGVREELAALRDDGILVGVVTNGAPCLQHAKITGSGLDKLVDAVVVSGAVGVGKPSKALFEACLEALGRPECAVVVGDNPVRDAVGASGCWLPSVTVVDSTPFAAAVAAARALIGR